MKNTNIARVCHELNRAYCQQLGDNSQMPWIDAPTWQKESAISGVQAIKEGYVSAAQDSHRSWMQQKLDTGWTYGIKKDTTAKTHPCLVPFKDLPHEQQLKDYLFFNTASLLLQKRW